MYAKHCRALVVAARAALVACGYVLAAEVTESPSGWTVVAHIGSQDLDRKDELLGFACEAIIEASNLSDALCVLGRKARPFTTIPMGFSARLGAMPRPQNACWRMMDQGHCKFGSSCHWQHPTVKKTLSVVVKAVDAGW